jgi:hypothetical protein
MIWVGHVSQVSQNGDMSSEHKILLENPEGKRPFGIPRHRWEDNIKCDLTKIGWKCVD